MGTEKERDLLNAQRWAEMHQEEEHSPAEVGSQRQLQKPSIEDMEMVSCCISMQSLMSKFL